MNQNVSSPSGTAPSRVAQLDQAIWSRLREDTSRDVFVDAWLTLQCRIIGNVGVAVAVLGTPPSGPYAPVAIWPPDSDDYKDLADVTEHAIAERRGVLFPVRTGETEALLAFPFILGDALQGAVGMRIEQRSDRQMRLVMRHLQWGISWIELMLRRERANITEATQERVTVALDMIAAALEQSSFDASCTAVATEIASQLDCERVAIGRVAARRVKIVALSHSAEIARSMDLMRLIGQAMDEAVDQNATIAHSNAAEADEPWVTQAHEALLRQHGSKAVLTVPLTVEERIVGALTLEHRDADGFDRQCIDIVETIASVIGPILEDKRANDRLLITKIGDSLWRQLVRLIGPGYVWRKLAVFALVGVIAFFAWYRTDYRVTAEAVLEGVVQRVIAAPFDGYLVAQTARAGDIVTAGQRLASLDDSDLMLERVSTVAEQRQRQVEYNAALAREERADLNILKAQLNQISARIRLIDAQLVRTAIVAPFDGIVVAGDHSQSIGAAVARGEQLYVIAPLSGYRVLLSVDERDINDIELGQAGSIKFASQPDRDLPFTISRITPVAQAADGVNRFYVEALLDESTVTGDRARLLPGMEGIGKIETGQRRLIWIWTHRAVEWVRVALWTWLP